MEEKPDISIVIVNYNVKDFLLQCLRSIEKASKSKSVETIVVDNDSSDGSVKFLEPLFPQVKFVQLEENLGFAKANNIGIAEAKGKFVLILNPDTILEEDTLEVMSDFLKNNPEVGCAGCKTLNPDGSFQLACRRGFPTPWASFCKLFGLQRLFPKSKLFAQYNQTYKSENETYYVDAVAGAFMFCRKEALKETGGFSEEYFMYGEDLDLCYRMRRKGWKIAYVHSASIIHYKGESSKRSSVNEIRNFYEAMEIFARKYYGRFYLFFAFLKAGIFFRSILAYANRRKREIFIILADILAINFALLVSTKYRFGGFLSFPDYAYPTVFIAVSVVMFISMIAVGEYFENRYTARRALFGLMISFFVLSSLTYYFKDFAFSRGVLLMTVGLTALATIVVRGFVSLAEKTRGSQSDKKIAVVGLNKQAENIIDSLANSEVRNIEITGVVSAKETTEVEFHGYPILGNIDYFQRIIENNELDEVIFTDESISEKEIFKLASSVSKTSVRFHVAKEFEDLLVSRIINEITGIQATVPDFNIDKLRYRALKRTIDVALSFFLLSIGLPVLYLFGSDKVKRIRNVWKVFVGKYSFVGIYKIENDTSNASKEGLISLAEVSRPERLSKEAIRNLNVFYKRRYSLSLDLDIILKYLFRKKSGKISS